MTSAEHLAKLDAQVQDFYFDCFDLFAQYVSHGTAKRWAWLVTADAFRGVIQ